MNTPSKETTNITLCSTFDHSFLIQALTLIRSVESNTRANINWNLLALTEECYQFLINNAQSNWNILRIEDLRDCEFSKLKSTRPWREYCWTSAAVIFNYSLKLAHTEFVGYVDADCFFLGDIENLIREISSHSLIIYRHNFSTDRISWLYKSGNFNVGVILGRNNTNSATCIADWRKNVLEECVSDPEAGKCGDQTYLNDWPMNFSFVKVSDRPGASLAPWNLNNFSRVDLTKRLVDNHDIDFFHFHGLQILAINRYLTLYQPAPGYKITTNHFLDLYMFYIRELSNSGGKYSLSLYRLNSIKLIKQFLRNIRHTKMVLNT